MRLIRYLNYFSSLVIYVTPLREINSFDDHFVIISRRKGNEPFCGLFLSRGIDELIESCHFYANRDDSAVATFSNSFFVKFDISSDFRWISFSYFYS